MRFCLLAAIKDLMNKKKKKKKEEEEEEEVGRRTSIVGIRTSNVKYDCKQIPEEILVEILVRLPATSLMRFKCVSKFWFFLISSKYFTDLFSSSSSTMRSAGRLFMYAEEGDFCSTGFIPLLYSSSSLINNTDSVACFTQLNHYAGSGIRYRFYFVSAQRGLMCLAERDRALLRIINLTTRQVLNVPCPPKSKDCKEWNYFGYDPVNNEYKLVRTIEWRYEKRSETQVLVLGAGASWRNTKSLTSPHHLPGGRGVFINGVLYCGPWSHIKNTKHGLVSFDFSSEEFNLIEYSFRVSDEVNLMNYQDQVDIIECRLNTEDNILSLWVLEDDAGENKWSHKTFVLPYHLFNLIFEVPTYDKLHLHIEGTNRRGEVKLSESFTYANRKSTHVLYDLEKNRIKRGVFTELQCHLDDTVKTTLWEDIENIMYLEA